MTLSIFNRLEPYYHIWTDTAVTGSGLGIVPRNKTRTITMCQSFGKTMREFISLQSSAAFGLPTLTENQVNGFKGSLRWRQKALNISGTSASSSEGPNRWKCTIGFPWAHLSMHQTHPNRSASPARHVKKMCSSDYAPCSIECFLNIFCACSESDRKALLTKEHRENVFQSLFSSASGI